ncbi:MAG: TonB-dependent receptor [Sphingomonadales bacterium]
MLSGKATTTAALLATISITPFLVHSQPAFAQTETSFGLEEIVVSARRREERLLDTPLSVSAFSGVAIEERRMQTLADVTHFVPNVQFDGVASESGGGASSQIAIRGIGQTDYVLTVEPAVGIYLDGVYVGRSVGSVVDAVDVERLEVLRGPQGTLFGKNTIAGAIQLISKRPSSELEGYIEATTGRYDRMDFRGAISGPISDAVRARVSGAYFSRDGHVKRVTYDGVDTGERQGNMDRVFGRMVVEFDLSDTLMATLSADGSRAREETPGHVLTALLEGVGTTAAYNAAVPGGVCLPSAGEARFSNSFCQNSGYTRDLKDLENTNSGNNRSNTDIWGTSLVLDWQLGDHAIKSITAYRDVKVDVAQQMQGSAHALDTLGQDITYQQFSQELQVNGTLADRLHYTGGLYMQRDKGRQEFDVSLMLIQFMSGGEIKDRDYAAYGQLTYDVTDDLSLTGGMRYSRVKRQFNPDLQEMVGYDVVSNDPIPGFVNPFTGAFGPPGTPLFPAGWYARTNNAVTWQASASYRFQPDVVGYVTASKGFKGGGFAMRYFPPVDTGPLDPDDVIGYAGPETAITYEAGLKTELMNRRLRLNLAAFYTDYDDIQLTVNVDPGGGALGRFVPTLLNAGKATIKGFEAETSFLVTEWLRVDGSLGYADAKYKEFSPVVRDNYANVDDFDFANTPEWTANIGGTLTVYNGDSGTVDVRADYSYRDGQFKEFTNQPFLYQKSYDLLNASVAYTSPDAAWPFHAGVTTLTNTIYIISGRYSDGGGYGQATVSRPREWFARVNYSF